MILDILLSTWILILGNTDMVFYSFYLANYYYPSLLKHT